MIEDYPLYWPKNRERSHPLSRKYSNFRSSFTAERNRLIKSMRLLGANANDLKIRAQQTAKVIISTNIPISEVGSPQDPAFVPDDPGATLYFIYKRKHYCLTCDTYMRAWENIMVVRKIIDSIVNIERASSSLIVKKFLSEFEIEKPKPNRHWWLILDVLPSTPTPEVKKSYLKLRSTHDPSKKNGDNKAFNEVQEAWEAYLKYMNVITGGKKYD